MEAINKRNALQQSVNRLMQRWENAPVVTVVANMDDPLVPPAVARENKKQRDGGAKGEPQAFYFQGRAYLNASQVDSQKEIAKAVFHEVLGHYGLRGVFGSELNLVLEQIIHLREEEVLSKVKEYGLDSKKKKDMLCAAEEVLAEMAQITPHISFVQHALLAIRSWLRRNVTGLKNIEFIDSELVRDYILPARAFVQKGAKAGNDLAQSAFLRSTTLSDKVATLSRSDNHPVWDKVTYKGVAIDFEGNGRTANVMQIYSKNKRQGEAKEALLLLKTKYGYTKVVTDSVTEDDRNAIAFWQKMLDSGVVNEAVRTDGVRLVKGGMQAEDGGAAQPKTQSPEFLKWFGNSKVVDGNGKPLVMYHGTASSSITVFKGWRGAAGHFAFTPEFANEWAESRHKDEQHILASGEEDLGDGAIIYPVYISAANIFDARNPDHLKKIGLKESDFLDYEELESHQDKIKTAGFDAYLDYEYIGKEPTGIAVFDPKKIKSAIGNNGKYDPSNADIRYLFGEKAKSHATSKTQAINEVAEENLAFNTWFNGSKVVDEQGKPMVVYHGTNADFSEFDSNKTGKNYKYAKRGFFFTEKPSAADEYSIAHAKAWAGRPAIPGIFAGTPADMGDGTALTMPVFLNLKKPLIKTVRGFNSTDKWFDKHHEALYTEAKKRGSDGLIIKGSKDGGFADRTLYIAFESTQIKSAIGNNGKYDPSNADIRYCFAGEKALTANHSMLETAKRRLKNMIRPEAVLKHTGWQAGADDKMRFEIDDSAAKLIAGYQNMPKRLEVATSYLQSTYGVAYDIGSPKVTNEQMASSIAFADTNPATKTLAQVLSHPDLFAAYPELADVKVGFGTGISYNGTFNKEKNTIMVSAGMIDEKNPDSRVLSTLLHEIQHCIQNIEGFARGGSPDMFIQRQAAALPIDKVHEAISIIEFANKHQLSIEQVMALPPQFLRSYSNDSWTLAATRDLKSLEVEYEYSRQANDPTGSYMRLAGEVEARNVQARQGFSAEERSLMPAYTTQDTKDKELIVCFDSTAVTQNRGFKNKPKAKSKCSM